MVERQRVTDEHGRAWVDGTLDPDTWFSSVRARSREQARRTVAARLAGAGRRRQPVAARPVVVRAA